ncbi:MAG: hypothetical protein ACRDUY_01645 [Nitriliruptorales bacterium]
MIWRQASPDGHGGENTALVTLAGDEATLRDMAARRVEVVRRLVAQGMPLRAIEALLPGWEEAIATVLEAQAERDAARGLTPARSSPTTL